MRTQVPSPPVFHLHVRVVEARREGQKWFALFEEPDGQKTWMEQPVRPTVGYEQVLYIIKKDTPENVRLGELVDSGALREVIEEYVDSIAPAHGAWCTKTWAEARGAQGGAS